MLTTIPARRLASDTDATSELMLPPPRPGASVRSERIPRNTRYPAPRYPTVMKATADEASRVANPMAAASIWIVPSCIDSKRRHDAGAPGLPHAVIGDVEHRRPLHEGERVRGMDHGCERGRQGHLRRDTTAKRDARRVDRSCLRNATASVICQFRRPESQRRTTEFHAATSRLHSLRSEWCTATSARPRCMRCGRRSPPSAGSPSSPPRWWACYRSSSGR
jgi:hypothetical protein